MSLLQRLLTNSSARKDPGESSEHYFLKIRLAPSYMQSLIRENTLSLKRCGVFMALE